jgi:hypothetical protein
MFQVLGLSCVCCKSDTPDDLAEEHHSPDDLADSRECAGESAWAAKCSAWRVSYMTSENNRSGPELLKMQPALSPAA